MGEVAHGLLYHKIMIPNKPNNALRVMIIDSDLARREQLAQSLHANGCTIVECAAINVQTLELLTQIKPDVIVIDVDSPDRDMLEHVCVISRNQPHPIVLFTDDDDEAKIKQAIRAGVTSYVVKGIAPSRIKPILQVAMSRFEEHQNLRRNLQEAQQQLVERKLVERAKGIVMKQKGVDEDAAYHLLRKMAMQRNAKLADIASQVVDLAQVFS